MHEAFLKEEEPKRSRKRSLKRAERSLKEVLKEADYKKILPIVEAIGICYGICLF